MHHKIYGLSCVENQVLSILSENDYNISHLYNNSAMPMKEIVFFLVLMGKSQEHFDRIPRIQNVLKDMGIINLKLCQQSDVNELHNDIRNVKENNYILMKADPVFTRNALHARGFREDHYVRIQPEGDAFRIINDIPEVTLKIPDWKLSEIYAGDFLKLNIIRKLTTQDEKFLYKQRIFKPEKNISFKFFEEDFIHMYQYLAIRLRNMMGIYKILRHRMAEYYGNYIDTAFISDYIPTIERYYAVFEYYNLRKNVPFETLFEIFNNLNNIDTLLMAQLKNNLAIKA